jgi:hypothetical protein
MIETRIGGVPVRFTYNPIKYNTSDVQCNEPHTDYVVCITNLNTGKSYKFIYHSLARESSGTLDCISLCGILKGILESWYECERTDQTKQVRQNPDVQQNAWATKNLFTPFEVEAMMNDLTEKGF